MQWLFSHHPPSQGFFDAKFFFAEVFLFKICVTKLAFPIADNYHKIFASPRNQGVTMKHNATFSSLF
jgi:hypothetical protein